MSCFQEDLDPVFYNLDPDSYETPESLGTIKDHLKSDTVFAVWEYT